MKLDPNLYPIDLHLEEIKNALHEHSCLLLKAETGAGKTTRLPPYLITQDLGKVLVLEPRRLAAKLSAQRCSETLNSPLGEKVGHHIRFDKKYSSKTDLLFITEGLFLHYLKESSSLEKFSVIIIDEFHERNIHTDIALTLIRRIQKSTRPDLKLIIMSATLDSEALEEYLEEPKVFNIKGRTFPLTIQYHPEQNPIDAILEMTQEPSCPLNILVFLPGVGAINALYNQLAPQAPHDYQVIKLYSSLPKSEQDKVFDVEGKKIILATNIAETSLTLPNVTGVIDLGLEKRSSFAPWSGMPLLLLEKISKASAIQRAGRAGRVQEGIVYRLYSEIDFSQRKGFTPPEIVRIELSHYILDLYQLNIPLDTLHWFEPPEEKNLERSLHLLELLGATSQNTLTDKGAFLADIPLHPRYGAILWQQNKLEPHIFKDIILAVSILSEGFILTSQVDFSRENNEGNEGNEDCDLTLQVNLIKSYFLKEKELSDYSTYYLDKKKAALVKELYFSLCKRFHLSPSFEAHKTNHQDLIIPLLQGFLDRVALKKTSQKAGKKVNKNSHRKINYNFCMGRGGVLSQRTALQANAPELILVLDALENPKANAATGTLIHAASKINAALLLNRDENQFLQPMISEERVASFQEKKETLKMETHYKYGNLILRSLDTEYSSPQGEVLISLIKENWPWPFSSSSDLDLYHNKVTLIERYYPLHPFAFLKGEMFDLFLASIIDANTTFEELKDAGLKNLIEGQMAAQDLYHYYQLTPDLIKLDNGKEFMINYEEETPFILARVQDLYSVHEHPTLFDGQYPLQIKLLSPANRIVQIIKDLPNFWSGSWNQVRQDMKSRYPKHYWSETPLISPPVRLKKDLN